MSFTRAASSRTLIRSLRKPASIAPRFAAPASKGQCRYDSTKKPVPSEKPERDSFIGQIYDITAERTEREREERRRFAKERGESASGRNFAITFGKSYLRCKVIIHISTDGSF